jgi:hypothetical protein
VCINPNGNDTWRFNVLLEGTVSDGTPFRFEKKALSLDQERRCIEWSFASGLLPFDVADGPRDANGFPLNARWGKQVPDINKLPDPLRDCPGLGSDHMSACSSVFSGNDGPGTGYGILRLVDSAICSPGGPSGFNGHANFVVATYAGKVTFIDHKDWTDKGDDDYAFYLEPVDRGGLTTVNAKRDQFGEGIEIEFDASDTIDLFGSAWWNDFHKMVDDDQPNQLLVRSTSPRRRTCDERGRRIAETRSVLPGAKKSSDRRVECQVFALAPGCPTRRHEGGAFRRRRSFSKPWENLRVALALHLGNAVGVKAKTPRKDSSARRNRRLASSALPSSQCDRAAVSLALPLAGSVPASAISSEAMLAASSAVSSGSARRRVPPAASPPRAGTAPYSLALLAAEVQLAPAAWRPPRAEHLIAARPASDEAHAAPAFRLGAEGEAGVGYVFGLARNARLTTAVPGWCPSNGTRCGRQTGTAAVP